MEEQVVQPREEVLQDEVKTVDIAASQPASQEMLKKLARYGVVGFEQPHEELLKEGSTDRQDMELRSDGQHIDTLKTRTQR